MATKKSTGKKEEKQVFKESGTSEAEEESFLEEEDDEEEFFLAEDAEEKIDEILGVPTVISSGPSHEEYPTEAHLKNRVKARPGDVTLPFNDTLILRKP